MFIQELVFSDKASPRIGRHLLFWTGYFINRLIEGSPMDRYYENWPEIAAVLESGLFFFPVIALFIYAGLFFILPHYVVPGRYREGVAVTALIFLLVVLANFGVAELALLQVDGIHADLLLLIQAGGHFSVGVCVPFFLSAMAVKITKYHILRERENQRLLEQQLNSSLHLMKAKLQPAVLLDALADIRMDINGTYLHAPEMILHLSELLHYILYETTPVRVDLARELKMVQDFLRFKSCAREEKITIAFSVSGNPNGRTIPPLLTLPLIDMIFRRSRISEEPFVITVSWWLRGESTSLSLISKQGGVLPGIAGFGQSVLAATRTNLEMNYPGRFLLDVHEEPERLDILMEFFTPVKSIHELA